MLISCTVRKCSQPDFPVDGYRDIVCVLQSPTGAAEGSRKILTGSTSNKKEFLFWTFLCLEVHKYSEGVELMMEFRFWLNISFDSTVLEKNVLKASLKPNHFWFKGEINISVSFLLKTSCDMAVIKTVYTYRYMKILFYNCMLRERCSDSLTMI